MKRILYLVHRLPYPPNKGDKITSYNLLKYLSKHYDVYLGCFVDDENDWQYTEVVEGLCRQACIVGLKPSSAKVKSLVGLMTDEPLTLPYYRNGKLSKWVDQVLKEEKIDAILIFSGAMAQYVSGKFDECVSTVLDLEDVDSDKWRMYGEERAWPMSWIYGRESQKLFQYEKQMAAEFGVTVLVSKEEADFFKTLAPSVAEKVVHRTQGVDSDYFDPALEHENPYASDQKTIAFAGAMDYWPNIDAAVWFAKEIFPAIKAKINNVNFYIVGMNPTDEVCQLAEIDGVVVTGGVPDIRQYVAHADVIVAPLRVARGIQNKVLEAMSMERPVLATSNAMHGINDFPGFEPVVNDTVAGMIEGAIAMLNGDVPYDVRAGRACVLENYNWDANLRFIGELLENSAEAQN